MAIIIKGSGTGKLGPAAGCRTCESYQDLPCGNSKLLVAWSGQNTAQQGVKIAGLGATWGYDFFSAAVKCGVATYFTPVGLLNPLALTDCSGVVISSGDITYGVLVDLWAAYAAAVWSSSIALAISINAAAFAASPIVRCAWVDPANVAYWSVLTSQGVCKARPASIWANTCPTITSLAGTLTAMDDGTLSIA